MKTIIMSVVLATSSLAFAAATCPESATTVRLCTSTPEAGDHDVVSDMFDSIAICNNEQGHLLVFEKTGQSESGYFEAEVRPGGSTYFVEDKDARVQLSVVTGTAPGVSTKGRLELTLKEISAPISSSYTCNN